MTDEVQKVSETGKPPYLEYLDKDNPFGVFSLLKGSMRQAIADLPDGMELLSERELRKQMKPTPTDYAIRTAFWRSYEETVSKEKTHMPTFMVFRGICSENYFYNKFLKDPWKVAWMVKPVQSYLREIESILLKGTERLWEIMEMDIMSVDKMTGREMVDSKRAAVLLEAIKMVENRAKGLAVQRSESFIAQANIVSKPVGEVDTVALEDRLKELTEKVHGVPPVVDGEVSEG